MRKATETLLKVIGTDAEVGTHAAVPEYLALSCAIKNGRDVYAHFEKIGFDREEYRQAVKELTLFLNQMSQPAFSRLMFFTKELDFHLDQEVGKAIKSSYALPAWCEEQVQKRAELLQIFGRAKPPLYTLEELENEEQVKAKYPWVWFDAIRHNYPERAKEELVIQLAKCPNAQSFFTRLPSLVRNMPREDMDSVLQRLRRKISEKEIYNLRREIDSAYERAERAR